MNSHLPWLIRIFRESKWRPWVKTSLYRQVFFGSLLPVVHQSDKEHGILVWSPLIDLRPFLNAAMERASPIICIIIQECRIHINCHLRWLKPASCYRILNFKQSYKTNLVDKSSLSIKRNSTANFQMWIVCINTNMKWNVNSKYILQF